MSVHVLGMMSVHVLGMGKCTKMGDPPHPFWANDLSERATKIGNRGGPCVAGTSDDGGQSKLVGGATNESCARQETSRTKGHDPELDDRRSAKGNI